MYIKKRDKDDNRLIWLTYNEAAQCSLYKCPRCGFHYNGFQLRKKIRFGENNTFHCFGCKQLIRYESRRVDNGKA